MNAPRLPAEWEPQSGVMLTWPHDGGDWALMLDRVEPVFVHIAREISRRESVLIVCRDAALRRHVQQRLREADARLARIDCRLAPSNDSWARDHGPITVLGRNGRPRLLDFTFNGWGGKYPAERDELHALRDADGRPYRLVPLPLPGARYNADGERLPATYANFLVIDGAVLVPTYDDPQDAVALQRLQTCFPGRAIIPIDARPLIEQFGSLHCVTMQLPAGVLGGLGQH